MARCYRRRRRRRRGRGDRKLSPFISYLQVQCSHHQSTNGRRWKSGSPSSDPHGHSWKVQFPTFINWDLFTSTSTSSRPTHPSVKQAHRTEDVPVESLNYLKRGIGDISGNLGLRFLKPCEAVDPHFPGFGLIFLLISDIKALKYNCLSRLSPQNISNPPLSNLFLEICGNFFWTYTCTWLSPLTTPLEFSQPCAKFCLLCLFHGKYRSPFSFYI